MPTPLEWLQRLDKKLEARRPHVLKYDAYYRNEHEPAVYSTVRWRRQFGQLLAELNDNWCELVVDAPAERMKVEGFRFGSGDEGADKDAWDIWQRNEMDAQHKLAIIEAGKCGEAYSLVETTPMGAQITVEHPLQCIVVHDPGFRRRRVAGLKKWIDDDGFICANLYTAEWVVKFRSREKVPSSGTMPTSVEWVPREDAGGSSAYLHGLGGMPLIPWVNRPSMLHDGDSDIRVVIPIQNAVNNLCRGLLATADSASFKQRWATGIDIPIDDETGQPPPTFLSGADRVWAVGDEDAKFGQFDASDLSNFTGAIEMFIQHIAALTRTPPHYLLGQSGAFPSGESLKATETGLVAKVRAKFLPFGEACEETMRMAFRAEGDTVRGSEVAVETLWADPESRTTGEQTDAALKEIAVGIPEEMVWARRLGMSPQEIARAKAMKLADAFAAPPVVPTLPGLPGAVSGQPGAEPAPQPEAPA